ncbi:MAG TPA: protein kinase [Vicinamibacteria bacterium]|nr:protein kinase [Vicinamibacteria bacterium]
MRPLFLAALLKVLVGVAAWFWTSAEAPLPSHALPSWYHLSLLLVFGICGALLYLGGKADPRTRLLGLVFLLFGSLFTDRLVTRAVPSPAGVPGAVAQLAASVHLTAFEPLVFWSFAWAFPRVQSALVPAWVPRWMMRLTAVAGGVLAVGTLIVGVVAERQSPLARLWTLLSPDTDAGWFWQVCSLLILPSLALLVAKLRAASAGERRRLGWVVGGLVIGSLPMLVHVLLATWLPRYAAFAGDPTRSRTLGIVLTVFSLMIPATAAYAVLVGQILEVRFLIRRAVQYALARYTVLGLMIALVAGLVAVGYGNRDRSLREMVGESPVAVLALGLVAFVLYWRRSLLDAIDRRFFREHYDARRILVDLVDESQRATTARDIVNLIVGEVDRALHLERLSLLVLDENSDRLRDPEGRLLDLDVAGALGILIAGSHAPLEVDLSSESSPLARLPEGDRQWLADAAVRLMVPLLGAQGRPVGVLALGEKKSELPYTPEDRQLMTAVAASAALALERKLNSESPSPEQARPGSLHAARQCVTCGRVQDRVLPACHACGSALCDALLPAVLSGKFEVERQIGAGGMGVVYRARDLALDRTVAIKVLPRVLPAAAARLRREARSMARLQHPNLAVVHAMESWRGAPVLVLEYLAGGTVAERIRDRPLPVGDVVALGVVVAEVLHTLHRAGYLHRDVKPSNIGYTAGGVAKLLDFGLVRLISALSAPATRTPIRAASVTAAPPAGFTSDSTAEAFLTAVGRCVGTLAYLPPEALSPVLPGENVDLWGLAVTLYECTTRKNPFAAQTAAETVKLIEQATVPDPREFRPDCPPVLAALLAVALSADRTRRPRTALDFSGRLKAAAREFAAGHC